MALLKRRRCSFLEYVSEGMCVCVCGGGVVRERGCAMEREEEQRKIIKGGERERILECALAEVKLRKRQDG